MEVIKPMDFSSYTAFCEHINKSTVVAVPPTSTVAAPSATTTSSINGNIYLEKMERQGKMELAAKEREAQRLQLIPKKWNRREEYEFLRVLTGYGIDLHMSTALGSSTMTPDWTKFKQMAHLERKSDETLSDYYKVFVAMCKRQAGVKLGENERGLEGIIESIKEEHAKLILDRLELLSKLREISRNPKLDERLKLCTMNADTPDWWEAGRHDKELIAAVLKHGLYRSETFIFNDPMFSFADSEKRFIRELESQIQRSIKLEAYNAEKEEKLLQKKPDVKSEVIDLDEELPTKESIIKKDSDVLKAEATESSDKEKEITKTDTVEESVDVKQSDIATDVNAEDASDPQVTNKENTEISMEEEGKPEKEPEVKESSSEEILDIKEESDNSAEVSGELMESNKKPEKGDNEKDDTVEKEEETNSELQEAEEVKKNTSSKEKSTEEATSQSTKESPDDICEENVNLELKPSKEDQIKDPTMQIDADVVPLEKEKNADQDEDVKKDETPKSELEVGTTEKISGNTENKSETTTTTVSPEVMDVEEANVSGGTNPDDDEIMKEKEKAVEEECQKQAAELKARFPDLEVIQPSTIKQKLEKPKLEMCMIRWFKDFALERRIAHIVACVETNKWPVDKNYTAFVGCKGVDLNIALHESIPHLNAVERRSTTPDVITITTDQGVTKHLQASQIQQVVSTASTSASTTTTATSKSIPPTTLSTGMPGIDATSINAAVAAAVAAATAGGNSAPLSSLLPGMSLSTAQNVSAIGSNAPQSTASSNAGSNNSTPTSTGKKRKRHIAIDVETERAKLHALLNSSQTMGPKDWENEIANMEALTANSGSSSRRNVGPSAVSAALSGLQPPPAHQHPSLTRQTPGQFNKPAVPPLKTSPSMGAPMDLSSGFPKMNMTDMMKSASSSANAIDLSEVQDFSMSSKKSNVHSALSSAFPSLGNKGKLDDTLNKLMKKNNCTIEEPVIGKEKKRKKLDEIVLGLSAAKEQKTFPDPSLPSSKKPQIPASVSVTPANLQSPVTSQHLQNQKPFTITVTTVPGKSKGGASANTGSANSSGSGGLSALQNMAMGGMSSKDSLNALLAQTMATDPQTFLKQQQKMMQCLPPAQRKAYENMLAEMEQAMKLSAKYNSHDTKVNKWLSDMSNPLGDQLSVDYVSSSNQSGASTSNSRRSSRQQNNASTQQMSQAQMIKTPIQQPPSQQQQSLTGPQGLTGEEPVPVINKQTGKRLAGNKTPQLKRLMQWLTENPNFEVDPKWLEQMQNPMSAPSPKPMESSNYSMSTPKSHGGRPSSTSSNASSGSHSQQQQSSQSPSSAATSGSSKKSSRQSAIDQAALQFGSLAGLNPSLLASLPGLNAFDPKNPLSAFDPKNPLLSMPFAGIPSMGNIPGLGNLNNMNLFASLAGMGGLGNLAAMDAQSLAAIMAAAGPSLSGITGTGASSSGTTKNQSQSSSSSNKKSKNDSAQSAVAGNSNSASGGGSMGSSGKNTSANQLAAGFPFLFPNPSLLYPPMGLGSLNPYSLGSSGLGSAYDQLAQQYNLLNGVSSSTNTNTTQSKSHQTQASKSSSARSAAAAAASANSAANLMNVMASMSGAQSVANTATTSSSSLSRGRQSSSRNATATPTATDMAQLSSLLLPGTDPHLLESLSRMAGMDLAQASRLMSSLGMPSLSSANTSSASSSKRAASEASNASAQAEKLAAKEQQKWLDNFARGSMPTDLTGLQVFSQGKLPNTSTSAMNNASNSILTTSTASGKNSKSSAAALAAAASQLPPLPGMSSDFSQALLAEMAAQMANGSLPLTGAGSLANLAGLTGGSSSASSSSSSASKRQREQDAFKQQVDFYTKTLGLGSGISLIPTSSSGSSSSNAVAAYAAALDAEHSKAGKRGRTEAHSSKDDLTSAVLASSLPLNLGASMASIEKSLRSANSGASSSTLSLGEADKVTLTPLNTSASAVLTANLPSQTTITIAPPISSGASTSSERSERSESRISLTITNAADAAKLPPPYEEADELIIQPILKKPSNANAHSGNLEDLDASPANLIGSSGSSAANANTSLCSDDNRRSSNRLKRPRSGTDHVEQPAEKKRELRSTRHTRQTADATLNLSTSSETEDRTE